MNWALGVLVVVAATIEGEGAKADAGKVAAEPDEQAARSTAGNDDVGEIPGRFEGAAPAIDLNPVAAPSARTAKVHANAAAGRVQGDRR